MPPDQLIGIEPVREQPITAEKLAINAVMAGCLPIHFPIVATAWQAMMQAEFLLHGVTSSTGGCAILIIINGPVRLEIGANATFNALGNSDCATSVIGRAIRLTLINLMDVRPGGIDRTTLGHRESSRIVSQKTKRARTGSHFRLCAEFPRASRP